jgi:hypothetical protein
VASWNVRAEGWLEDAVAGFSTAERWYVGRPLLVTENDRELGLANGDTGVIVQVGEGRVMAAFERGGELVLHPPSRLGAVDTVYAMTIHKSQGSQFAVAAVLLPEPGSRILTRELLYTAATRAQRRLILVGPEETIRAAVELSARYVSDRYLPDKAIDLIDQAGARKRLALGGHVARLLDGGAAVTGGSIPQEHACGDLLVDRRGGCLDVDARRLQLREQVLGRHVVLLGDLVYAFGHREYSV